MHSAPSGMRRSARRRSAASDARGDRLLHVDAAADEQDVDRAELLERDRGGELQPVAGRRGLAVEAHDGPLVDGCRRSRLFAMRSGSTAFDSAIIE